ncbi:two-component system response regulator [Helicobacter monodelphidis]|uniref:response regulator transcription factor n=1 Tax=Helicobacter sp. 15-1451 TaxID=2004995 RepID=UPI000DCB8488|nr:response regulator transcription factor [Helicobacter sp. 15-1451]RAX58667.1 two-component system response regulator [Helicobacter sp. 15-1451]
MAYKILVVEDDSLLLEMIEEFLSEEGFIIQAQEDAKKALELAYEESFDLYILDVKLPSMDGFTLLKEIRRLGKNTPAIYTTSLSSIKDLEEGFRSGCDDYLRKPFELKELLIRINGLLKRNFSHQNEDYEDLGNGILFSYQQKALFRHQEKILLPHKELELLTLLLQNKNRFVGVEEIFERLWAYEETPSELSLRAYIKNLRKLLGKERIINQRGSGYLYDAQS